MRVLYGGFLAVLLTFGFPALAPGATHEVQVGPGLSFTPKTLNIQAGDTVRWTNAGGFHNVVVQGAGGFRCANGCDDTGGNGNASSAIWSFQRTFTQPGAIHYLCEVHSGSGMTGDITVGGGAVPAAPGNLVATPANSSTIQLTWTDSSSNETGFRVEGRTGAAAFATLGTPTAGATSFFATSLSEGTTYTFRVRAENAAGNSAYSNEASATTSTTGVCVPGTNVLCIGQRFRVDVRWRTPDGATGQAVAIPLDFAPDSGLFYFFQPSNIEMLVKVLNACVPPFDSYWVFYAATTNVEFTMTVTDSTSGAVKIYTNPLNQAAAPVQDTSAFLCP